MRTATWQLSLCIRENNVAAQSVHTLSLISAFVFTCLDSIMYRVSIIGMKHLLLASEVFVFLFVCVEA